MGCSLLKSGAGGRVGAEGLHSRGKLGTSNLLPKYLHSISNDNGCFNAKDPGMLAVLAVRIEVVGEVWNVVSPLPLALFLIAVTCAGNGLH